MKKEELKTKNNYKKHKIRNFILVFSILYLLVFSIIMMIVLTSSNHYYSMDNGFFSWLSKIIITSIITALLSLIMLIAVPIVGLILLFLQNSIGILLIYPFLEKIFNFNYFEFLIIILPIFSFLLLCFLILSLFKNVNQDEKRFSWIGFFKSILLIIIAPILILIFLSFSEMLSSLILKNDSIFHVSLLDLLLNISIKNNSIEWGDTKLINLSEVIFKDLLFLIGGFFMIYYLFSFVLALGTRLFELLILGIAGVIIASSAQVYDEGVRIKMWNSMMIQKIIIPIISIGGYIIFLILLPNFIDTIENIPKNVFIFGVVPETKAFLELLLLISGSVIIKSLSTEWAFIIAGESGRSAFATQINTVMGDLNKPIILMKKILPNTVTTPIEAGTSLIKKISTLDKKNIVKPPSNKKPLNDSSPSKIKIRENELLKRKKHNHRKDK